MATSRRGLSDIDTQLREKTGANGSTGFRCVTILSNVSRVGPHGESQSLATMHRVFSLLHAFVLAHAGASALRYSTAGGQNGCTDEPVGPLPSNGAQLSRRMLWGRCHRSDVLQSLDRAIAC